jgi:hypothetical protein
LSSIHAATIDNKAPGAHAAGDRVGQFLPEGGRFFMRIVPGFDFLFHEIRLIVFGDRRFLSLVVDTVAIQEIIGQAETHILPGTAAVGAVKKYIALGDRDGDLGRNIKIDAVADLGHQCLFGAEQIPAAQAQAFGETALRKYIDRRPEFYIVNCPCRAN